MTIALTFEFFMAVFAALLLACGLFSYYLVDKLYTKAVCLYVATYELVEQLKQQVKQGDSEHESDNQ